MSDSSGNWIQQIFVGVDKLTDILNVGRLIFYTAAGALVVLPSAAALSLLASTTPPRGEPLAELATSLGCSSLKGTIFESIVVGFPHRGVGMGICHHFTRR